MTWIFLSIVSSAALFLGFKLFPRFQIDNLQAIIINYVVAGSIGLLFTAADETAISISFSKPWLWRAATLGGLFIVVFYLMAVSSQKAGISITSVAAKMEVIIPILAGIYLYNETLTSFQWTGIALALPAILCILPTDSGIEKKYIFLPVLIFFASGLIDTLVGYNQRFHLQENEFSFFSSCIFLVAALLGTTGYLVFSRRKISVVSLLGGILLGIPNYFSIYFLLLGLKKSGMSTASCYAALNIGTVALSAMLGVFFLGEKINLKIATGMVLAISALLLIAL